VRELEHTIERAVVLSRGEDIDPKLLEPEDTMGSGGEMQDFADADITIDEMERRMIMKTLERENGNKTQTAKVLGISVRTLRNKLNRYGKEKKKTTKKK
jgi:DNA-binding NtrC family response regulator